MSRDSNLRAAVNIVVDVLGPDQNMEREEGHVLSPRWGKNWRNE